MTTPEHERQALIAMVEASQEELVAQHEEWADGDGYEAWANRRVDLVMQTAKLAEKLLPRSYRRENAYVVGPEHPHSWEGLAFDGHPVTGYTVSNRENGQEIGYFVHLGSVEPESLPMLKAAYEGWPTKPRYKPSKSEEDRTSPIFDEDGKPLVVDGKPVYYYRTVEQGEGSPPEYRPMLLALIQVVEPNFKPTKDEKSPKAKPHGEAALSTFGDRITVGTTVLDQGIYRSMAALRAWQLDPTGTRREHLSKTKKERARVTASLPVDMWAALKDKPAVTLKMWLAVEARRHLGGHPMEPFPITPVQLAKDANRDDDGYVSPGLRLEVTNQLDALLRIESVYEFIGKSQKPERFRGPVYLRLGTHEVAEDLFGLVPQAIWIQRNPAFYSGYEGTFLKQTDHCTACLLKLNAKTDEVAIILGVYILCKARPQSHQWEAGEARFRVSTLLQELQEAQAVKPLASYAASRNLPKVRQIVEKALDKLEAVGFLEAWGLNEKGGTASVNDDLDSPDAIVEAFPVAERKGAFFRWMNSTVCLDLSAPNKEAQALSRTNKPLPRPKGRGKPERAS